MDFLDRFFIINLLFHQVVAVLGAGAATFTEIFYLKAIRDGKIEEYEAEDLGVFYFVMRFALIILVFTGFNILVVWRLKFLGPDFFYNSRLWAKYMIVLVILVNAILIHGKKIPLWLGSPLSLTSWWVVFFLGYWRNANVSFIGIIFGYVLALIVVGLILEFIKRKISKIR